VYISARTAEDCEETARELNELGAGSCIAIPANLQKLSEVDRLIKELASREKALHVLVNNAGAAWMEAIEDYSDVRHEIWLIGLAKVLLQAAWTKLLTLNVQRVFSLTQHCLPLLRAAAELGGREGESYLDPARIINASIQWVSVQAWALTHRLPSSAPRLVHTPRSPPLALKSTHIHLLRPHWNILAVT
jgi:NAD(P)-dependent dehydrogenase (short-subunit alcohol dehydrogenase family)